MWVDVYTGFSSNLLVFSTCGLIEQSLRSRSPGISPCISVAGRLDFPKNGWLGYSVWMIRIILINDHELFLKPMQDLLPYPMVNYIEEAKVLIEPGVLRTLSSLGQHYF